MDIPEWSLGDRLRKAREHAEMNQDQLASQVGVSKNSLSRYEQGQRTPNEQVLQQWAQATGVSLDWLSTGAVPDKPTNQVCLIWTERGIRVVNE